MHHSKSALLTTIAKILGKGEKNYCYASQEAYLNLLDTVHHIKINGRCFRKHIFELAKEGYIKKVRRWGRLRDGTIYNKTSAICLTPKGCLHLCKQGLSWAYAHLKKLTKYVRLPSPPTNTPEASHPDKVLDPNYNFLDDLRTVKKRTEERHKQLYTL
jgi:hypothetical protein